ncbi:MAG TPA: ATP-binding protein [Armatimonadota bacterium]|jgi:signal transduction histidine kinase/nitroreductase
MEFFDAVMGRRSIRRFGPEAPSSEVIERLVKAAHAAPYGTAHDDRHFVVLGGTAKTDLIDFLQRRIGELMPALQEASPPHVLLLAGSVLPTISSAPVLILAYTKRSDGGVLLGLGSISAAVENLLLAAYAEGLGTCWVTGATHLADDIAQHLGVDPSMRLVGLLPLGYPQRVPVSGPARPSQLYWRGFPEREELPLPAAAFETPEPPETAPAPATIMVVDDTPSVLDYLADTLERAGYQTLRCPDARQALELIEKQQPDLVIADALMSGMTGFQLSYRTHAQSAGFLPIVLTTTYQNAAEEAYGLERGADSMIEKPIRPATLLAHVGSLLRTKLLYDQVEAQKAAVAQTNEELVQLQQAQENLTHLIVHDLRTPLTSVLGGLNLVTENDYEPELTREMVGMAVSAGTTLLGLINDLLDVAKMESGQQSLNVTDFALGEVLGEVYNLTAGSARDRGLELEIHQSEPDLRVHGDADFTRRLLTNLVGNSLKFTFEGGVYLNAEADRDAGQVVISVRDTGLGIPHEAQAHIFEKFGQVEHEGAARMGTGLGLTFVKMAAEAMGGSIAVASEPGQGSTFTARLPLASDH